MPDGQELKEGTKKDEGKPRMDLIPPDVIEGLARILTHGAKKYADRNWENGMDWGRVYGAAQRHLHKFWKGEDIDPEFGELHTLHALCCIAFLAAYQMREVGNDDRLNLTKNLAEFEDDEFAGFYDTWWMEEQDRPMNAEWRQVRDYG